MLTSKVYLPSFLGTVYLKMITSLAFPHDSMQASKQQIPRMVPFACFKVHQSLRTLSFLGVYPHKVTVRELMIKAVEELATQHHRLELTLFKSVGQPCKVCANIRLRMQTLPPLFLFGMRTAQLF